MTSEKSGTSSKTFSTVAKGVVIFAAGFVASEVFDNRAVACLVDEHNKVSVVEADGDVRREPMLTHLDRPSIPEGVCEPRSFSLLHDQLPILKR